jgi:hypothetical protein
MFRDLFDQRIVALSTVSYKAHEFQNESCQIKCEDKIDILPPTDCYLEIIVTRKLVCVPEGPFEVSAAYSIRHGLREEHIGKVSWADYSIFDEIMADKDFFITDDVSRLSLIISQITSSFNTLPLVTPPIFIEEIDSKDQE